ncbi:hypothetical protein [Kitasatospora phosalacinea]|uniref:hypothetical protein n=1 Tax=Kitasatospora phosalacinea TaxID=2065 RepID=UPI00367931F2
MPNSPAAPAPCRPARRRPAALSVPAATLAGESGALIAGLPVALAVAAGLALPAKRS